MDRIDRLVQLMKYKDLLQDDETITDEMYELLVEKIDNEIANNYSIEEIDEVIEREYK